MGRPVGSWTGENNPRWKNAQIIKSCLVCGKTFITYPSREEVGRGITCSRACALRSRKNERHPRWKGGVSVESRRMRSSLAFKEWRKAVFDRDDYTCQMCGKRGTYLHPHHISQYALDVERRFDVTNGITYCKSCHMKWHKDNGKKKTTSGR